MKVPTSRDEILAYEMAKAKSALEKMVKEDQPFSRTLVCIKEKRRVAVALIPAAENRRDAALLLIGACSLGVISKADTLVLISDSLAKQLPKDRDPSSFTEADAPSANPMDLGVKDLLAGCLVDADGLLLSAAVYFVEDKTKVVWEKEDVSAHDTSEDLSTLGYVPDTLAKTLRGELIRPKKGTEVPSLESAAKGLLALGILTIHDKNGLIQYGEEKSPPPLGSPAERFGGRATPAS